MRKTRCLCNYLCIGLLLVCVRWGYANVSSSTETIGQTEPPNAIRFEHQFYGDFANRTTNLYLESYDYNAVSGWLENRLILGTWERDRGKVRPYFKTTAALSAHPLAWENTLVNGIGIEYRPWVDNARLEEGSFAWVTSLRAYAEYLSLIYLRDKSSSPDHDFRIGIDLWRERGLEKLNERPDGSYEFSPQWSEVYANLAYQDTNFYESAYDNLVFCIQARSGVRWPYITRDVSLMPYILVEVDASGHPYFWQNRAILGVGARIMPFQHSNSDYLNKTKIYVEYIRIMDYLKDEPTPGTIPEDDFRIGASFSLNRR